MVQVVSVQISVGSVLSMVLHSTSGEVYGAAGEPSPRRPPPGFEPLARVVARLCNTPTPPDRKRRCRGASRLRRVASRRLAPSGSPVGFGRRQTVVTSTRGCQNGDFFLLRSCGRKAKNETRAKRRFWLARKKCPH